MDDSLILHFHGGGLTEGSSITHRYFASKMVLKTNVPVLLFDYRLAPEDPYPAALTDAVDVYKEVIRGGMNPKKIIFSGDSSGCNLLLSTLIWLRDNKVLLPSGAFMISAHLDLTLSGETIVTRAAVDPFTSKEVLAKCGRLYAGNKELTSPEISPLFATLTGLPPFLLLVGDHEILLSDSERLEKLLKSSGCEATISVWEQMWHVWPMYPGLPEADSALMDIASFINSLGIRR